MGEASKLVANMRRGAARPLPSFSSLGSGSAAALSRRGCFSSPSASLAHANSPHASAGMHDDRFNSPHASAGMHNGMISGSAVAVKEEVATDEESVPDDDARDDR